MSVLGTIFSLLILMQSLMSFFSRHLSGFYTQIHSLDPDILSLLDLFGVNSLTGSGQNVNRKIKFVVQHKYAPFFTTQMSSA